MTRFILGVMAISLGGCVTGGGTVTNDALNQIALCSAGVSSVQTAKFEAKIAENIKNGVKIDAGIESSLKGAFLEKANVTEENATKLYDSYVGCLEKIKVAPSPGSG